jgi:hypothetical protein
MTCFLERLLHARGQSKFSRGLYPEDPAASMATIEYCRDVKGTGIEEVSARLACCGRQSQSPGPSSRLAGPDAWSRCSPSKFAGCVLYSSSARSATPGARAISQAISGARTLAVGPGSANVYEETIGGITLMLAPFDTGGFGSLGWNFVSNVDEDCNTVIDTTASELSMGMVAPLPSALWLLGVTSDRPAVSNVLRVDGCAAHSGRRFRATGRLARNQQAGRITVHSPLAR